jgi:hypothetical protein
MPSAAELLPDRSAPGDEHWSTDFNRRGVWGEVHAIGEDYGDLVIGGRFSFVGSTPANNIARWDGAAWHAYGDGVGDDLVSAVLQFDERLVVGGNLGKAGQDTVIGVQAAFWDGTSWHAMDQSDWQGVIYDLQVYHGRLYAGGTFWKGQGYQGLLVWDGARWQSVDAPFMSGWDLLVRNDKLLVAAGSVVCAWDGVSWSQPYGAIAGAFSCLVEWNGVLAAGGFGHDVGGRVWMWDGAGWQELGGGLYGWYVEGMGDMSTVWTLAVHNGVLCAGGRFELTAINGQEVGAPYAAVWAGDHWEGMGGGTTRYVYAMAEHGSELVVGGWMAYAGHVDLLKHTGDFDVWGLGLWDGLTWRGLEPLGKGLNGAVHCLGVYNDRLIAAGDFVLAGAARVKGIAAFDGESWSAMGGGLTYWGTSYNFPTSPSPRICSAMVEYEGDLVVAGRILKADDVTALNVARWDGQNWSAMGSGIPEEVRALCVYDGALYAGRYRWTGSAWEDVLPVDGNIVALCVWNGLLVMGGSFHNVGSVAAAHIAAWNGTEFFPLGAGTDLDVHALAVCGNELVAAGWFLNSPSWHVACWDGTAWRRLGLGVGNIAWCLSVVGKSLFVGGNFTHAFNEVPGIPVNYVTCWNDVGWHAMGSGCGGPSQWGLAVYSVARYHDAVYVGGDYTTAGGRPSLCLAEWRDPLVPVYLRRFVAERQGAVAVVRCEFGVPLAGEHLEVWRALPGSGRALLGDVPASSSTSLSFVDPSPPAGEAGYWLREVGGGGGESWYGPAHLAAASVPERLALTSVAPNPFNPRTTIRFALPKSGWVKLAIYDVRGARVATLVDAELPAGEQSVEWAGLGDGGTLLASGVYFARLQTSEGVCTVKVTLAK